MAAEEMDKTVGEMKSRSWRESGKLLSRADPVTGSLEEAPSGLQSAATLGATEPRGLRLSFFFKHDTSWRTRCKDA